MSGAAGATAINSVVSAISGIAYNALSINSAVSAVSGISYNASTINSLVSDSISGLTSGISAGVINLLSELTASASQLNNGLYIGTAGKKQVFGYYVAGPVSSPFTVAATFLGLNTFSSVQLTVKNVSGNTATGIILVEQFTSGATSVIINAWSLSGVAITALASCYVDVWGIGT